MPLLSDSLELKIAYIARQVDEGASVEEVCRKAGVAVQAYYRWRKRYGRLVPSEMTRLRSLEEENKQLKRLVAELSLTKQLLQESIRVKQ